MAIKFEGIENVLDRLEGIGDVENYQSALQKACLLVETEAVKTAPKDDGTLRNSITSKVEGLTGVVYTPLEYAPYVEYGTGLFATGKGGGRKDVPWVYRDEKTGNFYSTVGQHPQPFMRPALDNNRENIIKLLKEAMKND